MSEPLSRNRLKKPRVSPSPTDPPHGIPEPSTDKLPKGNGEAAVPPTLGGAQNFAVLEDLPAAVYTTDAEGRIIFFNEAAAALWGRRPNLGEAWCGSWRLYWPDGRPMAHEQCPMARSLRSGEPIDGEGATLERPDGSRVDFLAYPKPLRDASGKPAGGLNMLVDVTESKQTAQNLHDSEARYRGIFQNVRVSVWEEDFSAVLDLLDELRADGVTDPRAFFQANPDRLAEAIRRVRVIDVNDFSMELFDVETKEELLNSLAVVFLPATEEIFIEELVTLWEGRRQFENETMVRTLKGRHIDVLFTMAFEGERCQHTFVTLHDISAMKAAEWAVRAERQHFRTLNKVAQIVTRDLDLEHVVQTVTDVATELSGARFGAFFYNVTDEKGESLLLYTLSGAPREAFEKFGLPRNTAVFEPTFRGRGIVRSDDIRSDPRYGKNAPHHGMPKGHLPVVSYLAVPVVSRSGEVVGGLFFGHPEPGMFSEESELLVMGVAAHAASAIDNARLHEAAQVEIKHRQRAEETKDLLLNEVRHRVKNSLAMIQAVAFQTFRSAARDEQESFAARLRALSEAYDLLTDQNWSGAPVRDVVERALAPFREGHEHRFRITGSDAWLDARKSVLLALALHELATNALKYGALVNNGGAISLNWDVVGTEPGKRRIKVEWREAGGPAITVPKRTGFGSKLIDQALRSVDGGAEFDFAPQGAACVLEMPLD